MLEIVVLVSRGRHPVSGRRRRAFNDAQALELALALSVECAARVRVLHAGDPDDPALRGYLGMGISELHVRPVPEGADIVPPLVETLRQWRPHLILTGSQTEAGWSSGCLSYVLAHSLGYTLGPNIDRIAAGPDPDSNGTLELRQVCPRGRRRALRARMPVVATVDPAAPAPRQSAFARARRGQVITVPWNGETIAPPYVGEARAARRRPRRLRKMAIGTSADARLKALTQSASGPSRVIEPETAEEAASAIYTYLDEQDVLDHRGNQPECK